MHQRSVLKQRGILSAWIVLCLSVFWFGTAWADFAPGDCAGIDPVGYWELEEDGSTTLPDDFDDAAADDMDGNCDATAHNKCPVKVDGRVGFAQQFTATSFHGIDISPFAGINWGSADSFSIELWMKATTVPFGYTDVLVGRSVQSVGDGMHWFLAVLNTTGRASFYLESNASTAADPDAVQITGKTDVLDDQWHHLVAVRDGINETILLYVDGRLQAKAAAIYSNGANAFSDATQPLTIGYINDGSDFYHYNGSVDEVAVYDAALPESAIWAHFINGMQSSAIGYCGASAPIIDASTPTRLEDATVGFSYENNLYAGGNPVPSTFSLGLDAPAGMTLGGNTVQWKPLDTNLGDTTFEVTAGSSLAPDAVGDYTVSVLELCREAAPIMTAHWALEEAVPDQGLNTGTFLDNFLNGYDGACDDTSAHTVCPEVTTGILGGGQLFDETLNTGFDVAADPVFDYTSTDSFSIELWMKTPAGGSEIMGTDVLLGRTDVGAGGDMEWFVAMREQGTNVGKPFVYFHDADATDDDTVALWGESNLNDGQWHHLLVVRDGAASSIQVYVDGEIDAANGTSFSSSFASSSSANLNVGYLNKDSYFHFTGSIDEVALYNDALTGAMARQHYSGGLPVRGYCNVKPVISGQNVVQTAEETAREIVLDDLTVSDADSVYPDDYNLAVQDGLNYTRVDNTITPDLDFNGDLTVGVTVNDGSDTSEVFGLTVTVTPVNDAPVITAQARALSTPEETALVVELTDLTVTDPDNPPFAGFTLMVQDGVNYTRVGNSITPVADFNGDLTVPVTVDDGSGEANSESASFDLTVTVSAVNDAPVITGQTQALGTPEETALVIELSDLTVSDPDNTYPNDFSLLVQDGVNYTHGVNSITPVPDFNGDLTVSVTVDDGSGEANSESASFDLTVTVSAVNDRPVIEAQAQALSTPEETALVIELTDLTVTDPDNPPFAGFTLMVQDGVNYTRVGNSITPAAGFSGDLTVPVTVDDGSGEANSESAAFDLTVTVNPVNDDPQITTTAPIQATEDVLYTYAAAASDPEGDTLTWSLSNAPSGMSVVADTGLVSWTPGEGVLTSGAVTLTVADGNGGIDTEVFNISVLPVNDAPVITSTAPATGAQAQLFSYQATAIDAEGDTLTWSLSNEPVGMSVDAGTGLVTWTPDFGVVTSGTVVLTVSDGNGGSDSEQFLISVSTTNRVPVITSTATLTAEEGVQYSYQATATDEDGDSLTWSLTAAPTGMTVGAASGLVTWTPGDGVTSSGTVVLAVSDGNGGSDSETFTITVTPADDDGGGGGGGFCFINSLKM